MSPIPKQKLCWQCEGNVNHHDENCPYCGVYLNPEENDEVRDTHHFIPPYKPEIPESIASDQVKVPEQESVHGIFDYVKPLMFLLLGSTLAIFSFILFLFNTNGVFTLQWNANIWYLYLIVGLPLLWWGWRSLRHADSDG